jgi:anti-sigma regulatory factor (Ser/Thr protein kinase)
MARTDTIQNGHGPHRPDHWSALPWRPYASRAPLDTTADASVFHAGMLRRELRRWLDDDVTEHVAGDIILTAYEAIAEIITLADPLDAGLIRMQAHLDDDQVRVVISYTGSWEFSPDPDQSQRRLTLIRALTDHANFHREEDTITVHLTTYRQSPPQSDGYPSR